MRQSVNIPNVFGFPFNKPNMNSTVGNEQGELLTTQKKIQWDFIK